MSSQRVGCTINPETGKQIKIGGPTWKQLAATYYMVSDIFTDQTIPDTKAYVSNKVFGVKQVTPTRRVTRERVSDPVRENASKSTSEAKHRTSGTSSISETDVSSVRSVNVTYPVT